MSEDLAKALADMLALLTTRTVRSPEACDGGRIMAPVVEQLSSALGLRLCRCRRQPRRRFRAHQAAAHRARQTPAAFAAATETCNLGKHRAHRQQAGAVRRLGVQRGRSPPSMSFTIWPSCSWTLDARGDRQAANAVFNAYVAFEPIGGEIEGMACMPLFLACRAGVRAIVAMARTEQLPPEAQYRAEGRDPPQRTARRRITWRRRRRFSLLSAGSRAPASRDARRAHRPAAWAGAGGPAHPQRCRAQAGCSASPRRSGSTASITASARRSVSTASSRTRRGARSPPARPSSSDAVFAKEEERATIEEIAREAGCPFIGLWLTAPAEGPSSPASSSGAGMPPTPTAAWCASSSATTSAISRG